MTKLNEKRAELEALKAEEAKAVHERDELEGRLLALGEKIADVEAQVAELEEVAEEGVVPGGDPASRPCPKCATLILAGHKFCMGCGTPVASLVFPETRVCPGCGAAVDDGYKFCPECGKSLS